jgi:hypothetical protein
MMGVLALGAGMATGCDDDGAEATDAGGGTGGSGGDGGGTNANTNGGEDAGPDAEVGLMCGMPAETCTGGLLLNSVPLDPCCADNMDGDEVCGIDASGIPGFGDVFAECQEKDRGVSSDEHPVCDLILAQANGAKGIAIEQAGISIKLAGCCTLEGFCGVDTNNIPIVDDTGASTGQSLSLFLGCVNLDKFGSLAGGGMGGMGMDLSMIPCSLELDGGAGDGG